MDTRPENLMAVALLALILVACLIFGHDRSMETASLKPFVRSVVAEEFEARYRSVPVIQNPKYVTVYNGREVIVEE